MTLLHFYRRFCNKYFIKYGLTSPLANIGKRLANSSVGPGHALNYMGQKTTGAVFD